MDLKGVSVHDETMSVKHRNRHPPALERQNSTPSKGSSVVQNRKDSTDSASSPNKILTKVDNNCAIKQSFSMSSLSAAALPASKSIDYSGTGSGSPITLHTGSQTLSASGQSDAANEMIQAKVRAERPYNSLKKKRNGSESRDLWRRSWESHSSYSLNGGGSSNGGKDDFWAALQTNYNYIMDTNLIDSCREAHGEIVEFLSLQEVRDNSPNSSGEKTTSPESPGSELDPRRLRRWLREMENCILKSPTLSQAMRLKVGELQKLYEEHSELYCKIESQARVVRSCIRSAEKEFNERQQQQQQQQHQEAEVNDEQNLNSISSTSSSQKRSLSSATGSNLKGLEKRYHLLYLKAFEIQCMLESLLNKKEERSPDSTSFKSLSETDEEPAAKQRKLCPAGEELTFKFGDGGFENDTEEIFRFYGTTDHCYDFDPDCFANRGSRRHPIRDKSLVNASDADSEGSDCEKENKIQRVIIEHAGAGAIASQAALKLDDEVAIDQMRLTAKDELDGGEFGQLRMTVEEAKGSQPLLLDPEVQIEPVAAVKQPKKEMAPQQRTPQKRMRSVDSSKFNRSTRKSKNCATFYFKHLDTDSEAQIGGFSSQNDEDELSNEELVEAQEENNLGEENGNSKFSDEDAVASSEEDEWLYTNNKFNSTVNAVNPLDLSEDSLSKGIPQISISEDSVFERDSRTEGVKDGKGGVAVAAKVTANVAPKQCSMESIHQLVLNAENLVREEVFLQQRVQHGQQQQLTLDRRHHSHPQQQQHYHRLSEAAAYNRQSSCSAVLTTATTTKRSSKCNSGSNYLSEAGATGYVAMKASNSMPKKVANDGGGNSSSASSSARKCDQLKIKFVQEWLQQQPLEQTEPPAMFSNAATDCEASGEYTESDCAQPDSDSSSEGVTDSVATCLLGGNSSSVGVGSNSRGASTEILDGSGDLLTAGGAVDAEEIAPLNGGDEVVDGLTPIQHSKVVMRQRRRNSDRPWSVSSLSQLQKAVNSTSNATIGGSEASGSNNQLFANFSISESALHTLSPSGSGTPKAHNKNSESRSSLKRRKYKMKRRSFGKRSDSGSEGGGIYRETFTETLTKSESFSGHVNGSSSSNTAVVSTSIRRDSTTNSNGSGPKAASGSSSRGVPPKNGSDKESGEEAAAALVKPAFKLGSVTHVYGATNVGPMAKLEGYRPRPDSIRTPKERIMTSHETASEDISSEQAWDEYQEKYNSENYSEGYDTEAAKRFLEFGDDDYRRHIDSQSDCCSSSLSAANNIDSLSPPRHRKFGYDNTPLANALREPGGGDTYMQGVQPIPLDNSGSPAAGGSNSNTLRRRRALEFAEYERRRKNSESTRKKLDDRRRSTESSHSYKYSPKHGSSDGSGRKKSTSSSTVQVLKSREALVATTSSSDALSSENESTPEEDDLQIQSLLMQSRANLDKTESLRVRSHLLRQEDYAEILATCQENINGLGVLLRGPMITVLSPKRCQEMRGKRIKMFVVISSPTTTATATAIEEEKEEKFTVIDDGGKAKDSLSKTEIAKQLVRSFLGWGLISGPTNIYLRDRTIERVIFYAKVMFLTEIFSLLNSFKLA